MKAWRAKRLGGDRAYRRLLDLLRSGPLDLSRVRLRVYPLADLPQAIDNAAEAGNLEYIIVQP